MSIQVNYYNDNGDHAQQTQNICTTFVQRRQIRPFDPKVRIIMLLYKAKSKNCKQTLQLLFSFILRHYSFFIMLIHFVLSYAVCSLCIYGNTNSRMICNIVWYYVITMYTLCINYEYIFVWMSDFMYFIVSHNWVRSDVLLYRMRQNN